MKILVDKLPSKPQDCPHSKFRNNGEGYDWYGCSKGAIVCEVDKKGCPFYADVKTAVKEMVRE